MGATAMLLSGSGSARPIYMKYDDIKGEVTEGSDHDAWIELVSVSMAPEPRSGVNVAAGDVTGDGRSAARARTRASAEIRGVTARGTTPVPVGLLLPAIQKVRQAAAARPSGSECRIGAVTRPVAISESESGATGRILDATVTGCTAEQISFNFTKIEWD